MLNIDDTYKIYQPKISTCTFRLSAKFHMFVSIKCKNGWIGEFVESVLNLALLMKHFFHWLNDNRFRLCVLNTHFNGTSFIYVPSNVHVYANVLVKRFCYSSSYSYSLDLVIWYQYNFISCEFFFHLVLGNIVLFFPGILSSDLSLK